MCDQHQIDAAMAAALTNRMPCILCGGKAKILGMWIPNEKGAEELGAPLNKQRIVTYGLCLECKKLPNSFVEAVILRQKDMMPVLDLGKETPIPRSSRN